MSTERSKRNREEFVQVLNKRGCSPFLKLKIGEATPVKDPKYGEKFRENDPSGFEKAYQEWLDIMDEWDAW